MHFHDNDTIPLKKVNPYDIIISQRLHLQMGIKFPTHEFLGTHSKHSTIKVTAMCEEELK